MVPGSVSTGQPTEQPTPLSQPPRLRVRSGLKLRCVILAEVVGGGVVVVRGVV